MKSGVRGLKSEVERRLRPEEERKGLEICRVLLSWSSDS
jgi:hypothetical protein